MLEMDLQVSKQHQTTQESVGDPLRADSIFVTWAHFCDSAVMGGEKNKETMGPNERSKTLASDTKSS